LPGDNAIKEQVMNRFFFTAKLAIQWFMDSSFCQIINCHQFVIGQEPKENMNLWGNNDFPHSRDKNRL